MGMSCLLIYFPGKLGTPSQFSLLAMMDPKITLLMDYNVTQTTHK